jgi:hypothetical protein
VDQIPAEVESGVKSTMSMKGGTGFRLTHGDWHSPVSRAGLQSQFQWAAKVTATTLYLSCLKTRTTDTVKQGKSDLNKALEHH